MERWLFFLLWPKTWGLVYKRYASDESANQYTGDSYEKQKDWGEQTVILSGCFDSSVSNLDTINDERSKRHDTHLFCVLLIPLLH